MNADSARHTYLIEEKENENLKEEPEYKVKRKVEKMLYDDGKKCKSCGSKKLDLFDIEVDGKELYNFDSIVRDCKVSDKNIVIFSIEKEGGKTTPQVRGADQFGKMFIECALNVAINQVKSISNRKFIPKERGRFLISMTGPDREDTWDDDITIERLRNIGLSFDEVKHGMIDIASNFGMHIKP
ncbi:MAG: hypothetical protein ABEJ72_01215 [Candidatus Aenigmatarchaeota archaeon]